MEGGGHKDPQLFLSDSVNQARILVRPMETFIAPWSLQQEDGQDLQCSLRWPVPCYRRDLQISSSMQFHPWVSATASSKWKSGAKWYNQYLNVSCSLMSQNSYPWSWYQFSYCGEPTHLNLLFEGRVSRVFRIVLTEARNNKQTHTFPKGSLNILIFVYLGLVLFWRKGVVLNFHCLRDLKGSEKAVSPTT